MPSDEHFRKQDERRAKAAKKREAAAKEYAWKGFVNVTLTDRFKSAFDTWEVDDDLVSNAVLDVVEVVGKLSFSYDRKQGCFVAALTVTNTERPDAGYCVTARSVDLWRAMRRVVFIYWQVCAGDLTSQALSQPSVYTDAAW